MDSKIEETVAENAELSTEQMAAVTGGATRAFVTANAPNLPYRLASDVKIDSRINFDDQKVIDSLRGRLPGGRGGELDDTHGYVVF